MENYMLWRANFRRHKGSLAGIFTLIYLVCLALGTVLTVWSNSGSYVRSEMKRVGFGSLTAWVTEVPDMKKLVGDMEKLSEVERVESQRLIYSDYTVCGQESDSKGQLIASEPGENRYRIFTDDLAGHREEAVAIAPGQVYVSPSLISMFGVQKGDEIQFALGRSGRTASFVIQGFYEDPFMGSSMIGMKGFLIGTEDYEKLVQLIDGAGMNALAKEGAMLHVFAAGEDVSVSDLNRKLNEQTGLPAYTEFVHSEYALAGFMLILQQAFSGLMTAFVLVLLMTAMICIGHSLRSGIEADYVNMGILKTVGFTAMHLRQAQFMPYFAVILAGMAAGVAASVPVSRFVCDATLTTTGVRVPAQLPVGLYAGCCLVILILLACFVRLKTRMICQIPPVRAMRGGQTGSLSDTGDSEVRLLRLLPVCGRGIEWRLAFRQLVTGKRKYISACMVAVLLVFFASLVGRMDAWLGTDGKGMMDAFNPAEHDIGVQVFGDLMAEEAEAVVRSHSDITDQYLLAMPQVSVGGTNVTANVISEPERFHMMEGRTCERESEIVLTEFMAADLQVKPGDVITVRGDSGSGKYIVSGIYQCANDMGANVGMSREGYLKIGKEDPHLWCYHYYLEEPEKKAVIAEALEAAYGGDVHVHENSWPGLYGILAAMHMLVLVMYGMVIVFTLIVTILTGSRILASEQRDLAIYKSFGFSSARLRLTFVFRFALVAAAGSVVGIILAAVATDPLVASVMRLAGISNFSSAPGMIRMLFPAGVVIFLFAGFAYLVSGRIKRVSCL